MEKSVSDHLRDMFNKTGRYWNELPYFTRKENPEGYTAYNKRNAEIYDNFRADVEKEFGTDIYIEEIRDIIFARAWEDGHAYGYSEIFSEYGNVVHFVNNIINALSKENKGVIYNG